MMMGRAFGYGYGSFGCGILPMVITLLIGGVMLYFIMKSLRRSPTAINKGSQALMILNERLAKGEMTQEEYEKIKKVITN